MTVTLDKPKDQRLIQSGIDWQQFKLIEQGFSDSPGIRLFYFMRQLAIDKPLIIAMRAIANVWR